MRSELHEAVSEFQADWNALELVGNLSEQFIDIDLYSKMIVKMPEQKEQNSDQEKHHHL